LGFRIWGSGSRGRGLYLGGHFWRAIGLFCGGSRVIWHKRQLLQQESTARIFWRTSSTRARTHTHTYMQARTCSSTRARTHTHRYMQARTCSSTRARTHKPAASLALKTGAAAHTPRAAPAAIPIFTLYLNGFCFIELCRFLQPVRPLPPYPSARFRFRLRV